jgi:hypothetical protein
MSAVTTVLLMRPVPDTATTVVAAVLGVIVSMFELYPDLDAYATL